MLTTKKLPVPNVHFAPPGLKQVWPTSAACWSPSAEATGTPAIGGPASPYASDDARISGSIVAGTPIASSSSGSQSSV